MLCSVVAPCCNEEPTLPELHRRLTAVLSTVADDYEIVLVDDGSTDGTLALMKELAESDPHVRYVSLSRNFGQQIASTAGFDRADGDCVILMDADLQDPPECIPAMVAKWREGYEVVYAQRRQRAGVRRVYRAMCWVFYRLINRLAEVEMPLATGDFRLVDRKVVRDLRRFRESTRFVRGLISWIGYRQAAIEFDRPARSAGTSKYRFRRLFFLALDAVTGFSFAPLRIASALGVLVTLASLGVAAYVLVRSLVTGSAIPGSTLSTAGLFLVGGVQMMLLGLIGEYLGRTHREVLQRPLYLVDEEGGGRHVPDENQPPTGSASSSGNSEE